MARTYFERPRDTRSNQAVALNAAALMDLARGQDSYDQALETLLLGKAYEKLQAFIEFTLKA